MTLNAKWIKPGFKSGNAAPIFKKDFSLSGEVKSATLMITAMGVYEAALNGNRIGNFVLAPGWTSYHKRLQYQTYDVTELLKEKNELTVIVGKGWYHTPMGDCIKRQQPGLMVRPLGMLMQLTITYTDGTCDLIASNESFLCAESAVRFSEIYDGEIYDACYEPEFVNHAVCFDGPTDTLIPQQGEEIREQERISAARIFVTPKGETVIDFGQNLTGYVESSVTAKAGDVIDLSFAEVMDKEGNFYTENYRLAKAQYHYTCRDGKQVYKPKLTYWGFRYIRINEFPGGIDQVSPDAFTAIVIHSDMKRTGYLSCSNTTLNKFFSNVIWGQKGNFVDIPTDCPQRDERLGWTGDAQVFIRTACLNYDVEKFFTKWLADLAADQYENGCIRDVAPLVWQDLNESSDELGGSAAWGDAATICPWSLYLAYGNKEILKQQFDSMKKWIDYITDTTTTPDLWTGRKRYGDWLGLDAPSGSYRGSSDEELIASAFYAYSTLLLVKSGKVLGKDMTAYEALYDRIVAAFRKQYPTYRTQTECVIAAHFNLAEDCQAVADQLAQMIISCGTHLETGFVGTPYLLHVLSKYGYSKLAYSLLLREEYPSWLYQVTKGATTVWEHWDGIMEDGNFWSADMNSFNHYAYGSVTDWVYTVAAGINTVESAPGYEKILIAPTTDERLDWLKASVETRHGLVSSLWKKEAHFWRHEITTPVETTVIIDGISHQISAGTYYFYSKRENN